MNASNEIEDLKLMNERLRQKLAKALEALAEVSSRIQELEEEKQTQGWVVF